jgi:hypothetical protein
MLAEFPSVRQSRDLGLENHCDSLNQPAQCDVSLINRGDINGLLRPLGNGQILVGLQLADSAIETINFCLELVNPQLTVRQFFRHLENILCGGNQKTAPPKMTRLV